MKTIDELIKEVESEGWSWTVEHWNGEGIPYDAYVGPSAEDDKKRDKSMERVMAGGKPRSMQEIIDESQERYESDSGSSPAEALTGALAKYRKRMADEA